uniref:Uncharacterized protein n=1 Tax=Pseudomonas phage RVTF4 TaxID=3236931 RepID=A0AB39CCI5_9VIRU
MTEPTDNVQTLGKKRGIRTFENDSFTLVLNKTSGFYDLAFEGKQYPIRFAAPEGLALLTNPLAGGLTHKSGRHTFTLTFAGAFGDKLVSIVNEQVREGFEKNAVPKTEAVQVPVESDLAKWIVVAVEMPVIKALRLK